MGQSKLPQQKSWSLLSPRPRNAIPESIASHSSLFPSLSFSLSFSLSLSLSLCPISGDSSSDRKRPKSRRRGSQLLKRFQILNTRVDRRKFSSQHVALNTKNKIPLLKLIFVLLIYYLKYHNSSTYITHPADSTNNVDTHQLNFTDSVTYDKLIVICYTVISPLFSSLFIGSQLFTHLTNSKIIYGFDALIGSATNFHRKTNIAKSVN